MATGIRWMEVAALVALWVSSAAGQGTPVTSAPGGMAALAEIQRRLASEEFSVRAAAQRELAKVPLDQLDVLRTAAATERDEEVKARLSARISEMELFVLLHPPPVSVDLKQARAADLANELNKQMGGTHVSASSPLAGDLVTLKADGPFWEVLRQYNDLTPVNITSTTSATTRQVAVRITPLGAGNRRPITVVDGFGIVTQLTGTPAAGTWALRTMIYADPRVKIMRYASSPRIDSVIIQDGRQMLPMPGNEGARANLVRPSFTFTTSVTFPQVQGVTSIRELRGVLTFEVVERERTVKLDVRANPIGPIETPFGALVATRAENGEVSLRTVVQGDAPATVLPGGIQVYVIGKSGAQQGSYLTTSSRLTTTFKQNKEDDPISSLEISFVEKSREVTLPIRLTNIELPGP